MSKNNNSSSTKFDKLPKVPHNLIEKSLEVIIEHTGVNENVENYSKFLNQIFDEDPLACWKKVKSDIIGYYTNFVCISNEGNARSFSVIFTKEEAEEDFIKKIASGLQISIKEAKALNNLIDGVTNTKETEDDKAVANPKDTSQPTDKKSIRKTLGQATKLIKKFFGKKEESNKSSDNNFNNRQEQEKTNKDVLPIKTSENNISISEDENDQRNDSVIKSEIFRRSNNSSPEVLVDYHYPYLNQVTAENDQRNDSVRKDNIKTTSTEEEELDEFIANINISKMPENNIPQPEVPKQEIKLTNPITESQTPENNIPQLERPKQEIKLTNPTTKSQMPENNTPQLKRPEGFVKEKVFDIEQKLVTQEFTKRIEQERQNAQSKVNTK